MMIQVERNDYEMIEARLADKGEAFILEFGDLRVFIHPAFACNLPELIAAALSNPSKPYGIDCDDPGRPIRVECLEEPYTPQG